MRRCASTTPALGRSSSRCPPKDRAEVSSPTSGRSVGGLSSPFELVLFDKFSSRMLTRVIDPDTKDWMWVLERACPECGFDASKCEAEDVAGLIRDNAQVWERFRRNGTIRPGRPNESTWSTLEYACHVRDVYRLYRTRIECMLTEDDPLFENWDQDAAAIAHSYEQQAPEVVAAELAFAAESLASALDGVSGPSWLRPGRRSDGASFSVGTIARCMIHDPIHHAWDVHKQHS